MIKKECLNFTFLKKLTTPAVSPKYKLAFANIQISLYYGNIQG